MLPVYQQALLTTLQEVISPCLSSSAPSVCLQPTLDSGLLEPLSVAALRVIRTLVMKLFPAQPSGSTAHGDHVIVSMSSDEAAALLQTMSDEIDVLLRDSAQRILDTLEDVIQVDDVPLEKWLHPPEITATA